MAEQRSAILETDPDAVVSATAAVPADDIPTPNAANLTAPTVPLQPYAARPRPANAALRLLPLDGFIWGGAPIRGQGRAARVRGDHCLIRVTGGAIRIMLPRSSAEHGPGAVIFIPAGTAFAAQPSPDARGQVLLLRRDAAVQRDIPLPGRMVVGQDASDALSADLAALVAQMADPLGAATADRRIGLISAELQRIADRPAVERPALPGAAARDLLASFLDLAGREMGRGRTLADLAEALGTTAAGLDLTCRQHRGRGALELIYELRMDRARALLADRSRSVAEIAAELGFTGAAHLNRVFINSTGRPAEAFRPN